MKDPNRPHDKETEKKPSLCELAWMSAEPQSTDVLGSYTGTPRDGSHPVQDADDL